MAIENGSRSITITRTTTRMGQCSRSQVQISQGCIALPAGLGGGVEQADIPPVECSIYLASGVWWEGRWPGHRAQLKLFTILENDHVFTAPGCGEAAVQVILRFGGRDNHSVSIIVPWGWSSPA